MRRQGTCERPLRQANGSCKDREPKISTYRPKRPPAAGVDGAVRRIDTACNDAGLPYLFTSFADTAGTVIVNQVMYVYNGLGQVTRSYQAVNGAVDTSTTPFVQYDYSDPSIGSRLIDMVYPNGRTIDYTARAETTTHFFVRKHRAAAGAHRRPVQKRNIPNRNGRGAPLVVLPTAIIHLPSSIFHLPSYPRSSASSAVRLVANAKTQCGSKIINRRLR